MKPSRQTLFDLFDRQRRYEVPLFQRPYVWGKDKEWGPLWEDIEDKATAVAESRSCHPHFLGAVVLNQCRVYGKEIDAAEIIDGQQRLTTLQIFLAAFRDVAQEMGADRLYAELVDLTRNREVSEFRRYSEVFRTFVVPSQDSRVGLFAHRLKVMDVSTLYPLLLLLLVGRADDVTPGEIDGIVTDLESFLVRRLVGNLTTKNYNLLFRSLLRRLREADVINRATVRHFLLEGTGPSVRWPNDREFEKSWLANGVYGLLKSPRITAILEAIDLQLVTNRQEQIHLPERLSVEHVMPERWQEAWPAPPRRGAAEDAEESPIERRDRLIHTLGNLTLLTQVLNSSVSNGPFSAKRGEITQQSRLRLNAYFQNVAQWDEEAILQRGRALLSVAMIVWPFPG